MNKSVIILTPKEWEGRISLLPALKEAHIHSHLAISKQAVIDSLIMSTKQRIKVGRYKITDIELVLNQILVLSQVIVREIQESRSAIHQLDDLITAINDEGGKGLK